MMKKNHNPGIDDPHPPESGDFAKNVPNPNSEAFDSMSPGQMEKPLHEMRFIQIELEMQNQELLRIQTELITSKTRYFDLYNTAPIGFCTLGSGGLILQANIAATALLGSTGIDPVGQYFINLIFKEDFLIYDKFRNTFLKGDAIRSCELRVKPPGGVISWVELSASIYIDDSDAGAGALIQMAISDISQRINAESALHLISAALNSTTNAVSIMDRSGIVEWINPAHAALTGYTALETIGKPMGLTGFFEHGPTFHDELWLSILAGKTWQGELQDRHKTGSLFTKELTVTPLIDGGGNVTHAIVVQQDITQRKLLEEQFRQSQKMQAFGDLAGGIAHDFNNILGTILLQADVMEMGLNLSGEARDGLQQIRKDALRGAELTRHLLVFGRKQIPEFRDLDLNVVVTNLVKMVGRLVGDGVKLRTSLAPCPLITRADSGMLDQVVMNLVGNALDAMPGGGEIFVQTTKIRLTPEQAGMIPDSRPGLYVVLRFGDTGCGIPPEILGRIYEPFFTTKDIGKGTGLGLATVYGIVNQHKGLLHVESKVGSGTTFEILLPASSTREIAPQAETFGSEPVGGKETILLVEDQAALRILTGKILEKSGYFVLYAADGVDALEIEIRHRGRIDLLMTDLQLPRGITGDDLADRLSSKINDLRTIFISGGFVEFSNDRLHLSAKRKFIKKPATPRVLLEMVRICLDA